MQSGNLQNPGKGKGSCCVKLKYLNCMTGGEERDKNDYGNKHGAVDKPCEAERSSRLYSMESPRKHTLHQSHQDWLVRQGPATVVFLLFQLGLRVGVADTKLGPLIAVGIMPSQLVSSELYLSSFL